MKVTTSKTESSRQLRKATFGRSFRALSFWSALGLALLSAPAFADVVGLFKFDNFPTNRVRDVAF
jgi:hypothetical protein